MTTKRGKIIRDTNAGDGIMLIDGKQYLFSLEIHWKGDVAPKIDMLVDAEFDVDNALVAIRAVPQNELVKEQFNRVAEMTQQVASDVLGKASTSGLPVAKQIVSEVGIPSLAAIGAVFISWMFLNTFTIHIFGNHYQGFTFYDVMKLVNNAGALNLEALGGGSGSGAGFYGLLCFLAILLPFVPHFVKVRHAWLAYNAPLALFLITLLGIYMKLRSSMQQGADIMGQLGGARMAEIASQMMSEMMKAVSMGLGFYLALLAAAYLAVIGTLKFMSAR